MKKLYLFFAVTGLVIIGITILANRIGLDPNPGWGKTRIALLVLGILLTLGSSIVCLYGNKAINAWRGITTAVQNPSQPSQAAENRIANFIFSSNLRKTCLLGGILIFIIITFYVWLTSVGLWTTFPPTTSYYDWLSTSFQHGHLSLEVAPDPALLALPNPYDPVARDGLNVPGDVSLFNGKYYLYFGPAPALILEIVKPIFPGTIGDQYLVFAFITGIFLIQLLLMFSIWKQFFGELPGWTLLIGILILGLENPLVSMLAHADIHEAAIASGQLFFLGGLYFVFTALNEGTPSTGNLVLAGIFWAVAIGSRTTLLLPVSFMILMMILRFINRSNFKTIFSTSGPILVVGTPIALGVGCLAWYNWARFGSVFEFGFLYQLTWNNIREFSQTLFSPVYILQNLYNYLLSPFRISHLFPFVMDAYGEKNSVLSFIKLPSIYYADLEAGILVSTPFILLAIIPTVISAINLFRRGNEIKNQQLNWLCLGLIGSGLTAFAPLVVFFWNAVRYLAEFTPVFILLSIVGYWQGYASLKQKPVGRKFFIIITTVMVIISVLFSILLSISMGLERFRLFNPDLIHWLRNVLVIQI